MGVAGWEPLEPQRQVLERGRLLWLGLLVFAFCLCTVRREGRPKTFPTPIGGNGTGRLLWIAASLRSSR